MNEVQGSEVEKKIAERLNSFNASEEHEKTALTRHITLWVTEDTKTKYDAIQAASGHRFTKTLRDVLVISVDDAYSNLNR